MLKEKEAMVEASVKAINAYCRVLELQIKAVAQSIYSPKDDPLGRAIRSAQKGLEREVEFLSFLREGNRGKDYPEG